MTTNFVWAFKRFLKEKSAYALANSLGISEKAIHAWATEEDSPFHRRSPLDRAIAVLDAFKRHTPSLLFEVLSAIVERYGYRLESFPSEKDCRMSELLKELNDVPEELVRDMEDGKLSEEELERAIKEITEAQEMLAKKKAWLSWKLEQLKPIKAKLNGR